MERASFEVQRLPGGFAEPFLPGAQRPEVLRSLGGDVGEQLQDYPAGCVRRKKKKKKVQLYRTSLDKYAEVDDNNMKQNLGALR